MGQLTHYVNHGQGILPPKLALDNDWLRAQSLKGATETISHLYTICHFLNLRTNYRKGGFQKAKSGYSNKKHL
jgi:hypothetical protein